MRGKAQTTSEIPEGWEECSLGDVADFRNGKSSPQRDELSDYDVFGSNGVIGRSAECNSPEGTVIVGRVGSYCGSVYFSRNRCWVTDNAIIGLPRVNLNARYLYYLLLNLNLNNHRGGSGQPLLNQGILNSIPVCVPPLEEQCTIAKILGDLDDKIELNRRMNETLEAMARAIFERWFVDNQELMRSGKIGEICTLSRETISPTDFPNEVFDHYSIPAFDETCMPKEETGEQIQSNKFIMPANAVMISKLNPRIPRVWFPVLNGARRSVASTEFLVAIPNQKVPRDWIYGLFCSKTFLDEFTTLVTGTSGSHQRVKPEYLLAMDVAIPSRELVTRFTETARPLYQRVAQNCRESHTLAALRDTLLPKLISGELRVKDSEKLVATSDPSVKSER